MIGTIIAGAASAIGSIWGAANSASAARKARQEQLRALDRAEVRNENNYNYQMGMPRYSATTLLDQTADAISRRNEARRGAAKVVGGTSASLQAGSEQDLSNLGTVTQNAIAQGLDSRKTAAENYTNRANQIDAQRAGVEASYAQQQAQNTSAAVQGLAQTAGIVASGLDGAGKGKPNTAGGAGKQTPVKNSFNMQVDKYSAANLAKNNPMAVKARSMGWGKVEQQLSDRLSAASTLKPLNQI